MRASRLLRSLWLLALAGGSAAITYGSLVYFDAGELPPFVIEKLPLPMEAPRASIAGVGYSLGRGIQL